MFLLSTIGNHETGDLYQNYITLYYEFAVLSGNYNRRLSCILQPFNLCPGPLFCVKLFSHGFLRKTLHLSLAKHLFEETRQKGTTFTSSTL